jgi:HEAT repeats
LKTLAACLLCALFPLAASCDVMPIPGTEKIAPAFEASDIACNCEVRRLETYEYPIQIEGRPGIHRQTIAEVEAKQLFKPDVEPRNPIRVVYEMDLQMGMRVGGSQIGLSNNETALMFLKMQSNGDYGFAEPLLGATALKFFPVVTGQPGLATLQKALAAALQSSDRRDIIQALQLLQGMNNLSPEILAATLPFEKSSDPEIAIPAVGVQLTTKTPQSAENLAAFLERYHSDAPPISLISLGSMLLEFDNPDSLPILEKLANNETLSVRYGAMDAIRKFKSLDSVPFLIKQLDDSNSNVQYVALISLAEILKFGGEYSPGMGPFDADPQRYLSVWKKWWRNIGKARYGNPT